MKIDVFPKIGFLTDEKKAQLEKQLNISIKHTELFEQALTHRSYVHVLSLENGQSNERLEFLGDSILGFVIAEYLFDLDKESVEGDLTKMRSWLVNMNSLAFCAQKINLDKFLMLSYSAENALKKGAVSILADALEAMIAAIYLDSGIDEVRKFIIHSLIPLLMEEKVLEKKNYKSILLEELQALIKKNPFYKIIDESGPAHDRNFVVGVYVEDEQIGSGSGKSKKQAEQLAAQNALENKELLKKIQHHIIPLESNDNYFADND